MNTPYLVFKNLSRNKRRTLLTIAAIALPMFAFTFARTMVDGVNNFLEESNRKMRVAVHHKLNFTTALPERMRGEIEEIAPPGYIDGVCRFAWFGGSVKNSKVQFMSFGVDRDTLPNVYKEFEITPEEHAAFQAERRAAIVGKPLADEMNWKVGDRVTLRGGIPPFPEVEFVIAAIPPKCELSAFYFGHDYYNEVLKDLGAGSRGVNNFWMRCSSDNARQWALSEIDKHFENTEYETKTEMESTFVSAFMRSGGDWVGLVWTVGRMVVLVAVMVALNTMSMAFRERTREMAAMRALGFPAGRIRNMLLAEGLLLGVIGGLIAVVPPFAITHLGSIRMPGMSAVIKIPLETALTALGVATACGMLAALAPAWLAGRLQVATALRKVV